MLKFIEIIDILKDGIDITLDIYDESSYNKTISKIKNITNILEIIENTENVVFNYRFNIKVSDDTNIIMVMEYDTMIISISTGILDLLNIDKGEFSSITKHKEKYTIDDILELYKMLFLIQRKLISYINVIKYDDSISLYNNISNVTKVNWKYRFKVLRHKHKKFFMKLGKNIYDKYLTFFISRYTKLLELKYKYDRIHNSLILNAVSLGYLIHVLNKG